MDPIRAKAQRLAREYLQNGNFMAWFEALYATAGGDPNTIPWADMVVNPHLAQWLAGSSLRGDGKKALVVGCGLGDDAEQLARIDFAVVAFDVSPTAIEWCRRRFPDSEVDYVAADLFTSPKSWSAAFDFVFEAYTLQSLPPDLRPQAIERIAGYLAPKGTLLVVTRGRDPHEEAPGPPWALAREELAGFTQAGLGEMSFEDYIDPAEPPTRRFRVVYRRLANRA